MQFIRHNHPRNGATAVEFAMVAPVAFMLIFGLFECSRLVMVKQAATNAAREGGRKSVLATTTTYEQIKAVAVNHLLAVVPEELGANAISVTVTPADFGTVTNGTLITTTVAVKFADISWLPQWFFGDLEVRGTSTMERD